MASEKTIEIQKKKKGISSFWQNLMLDKKIVGVFKLNDDKTMGYIKKNPIKPISPKESKEPNHKKSNKARRLMAKKSRRINRRR